MAKEKAKDNTKENKDTLEKTEASAKKAEKKAKKNDTKSKGAKSGKDGGKKPNAFVRFFKAIGKWFHDLRIEFKNVTWPTWHTTSVNTGVVLATIVISSTFIGLLDSGLLKLMEFLLGLGVSS